MTVFTRKPS